MPATRQRRLDALIAKTKTGLRTLAERRKLKSLLYDIDRTALRGLTEMVKQRRD
jgi:hypothetical protein